MTVETFALVDDEAFAVMRGLLPPAHLKVTMHRSASDTGFNASIQIIGRPGDDERVLAAGIALEAVLKR